jgi:plastocyanin
LRIAGRLACLAVLWGAGALAAGGTGELAGTVKVVTASVSSRVTGLEQVVVYLDDGPNTGALAHAPYEMSQVKKTFVPDVLVVPQGATVTFPNLDPVSHNVFSVTPGHAFDLGLHKTGDSASVKLDAPGVISVFCDIHPQMIGYILVVSSPYFTRATADGTYQLRQIPPGTYHATAWFPFGPPVQQEVQVRAGGHARLDFVLRERSDAGRHPRKDGSGYLQYGEGEAR